MSTLQMRHTFKVRQKTDLIILHSSQLSTTTWVRHSDRMVAKGREMGLLDIGYHWVIEETGEAVRCRPVQSQGSHCPGYDRHSVGICLAGNLHFTIQQKEALRQLCDILWSYYGLIPLVGHTELPRYTGRQPCCPISAIDMKELRDALDSPAYPKGQTGRQRAADADQAADPQAP